MKKILIPVLLVVAMAVGCAPGGPIIIGTGNQPPVINSFSADPPAIAAGESSTLSWTVSGATSVSIDQGIGSVALSGSRAVTPATTTIYTLTATNPAGSVTATAQVAVSGAPPPSEPPAPEPSPPTPTGLPVVSYFTANPPIIATGGSTTLSWSVSNATSVTIEPGVGTVGPAGTASVSPATSTTYTLTASNAAGWYSVTVTVIVTAAPPAGQPDLVITDISRTGDTITYKIKNQGDATAGPSTSRLRVDGVVKANDSVGSLSPGQERTESFAGYTYECSGTSDSLVVEADAGDAVAEASEANNSYSESWLCIVFLPPTPPLVVKKADLVIEDIWLRGNTVYYRIKNQGSLGAGPTKTALYTYPCLVPCQPKAYDAVPSLAAGASSVQRFATYSFSCPVLSVKVEADKNGDVAEWNEGNNSRSEDLCP
ncbi:MAG TPA: hypothetical protein EYP71_07230 [Dehalococcoidia bacterium]|nr:hypothetical protein [Dehalococcoidia bacterium]